jgi:hypothetical protein
MLIANSPTNDPGTKERRPPTLSYSLSLETALQLILADPAFLSATETPSFKFIQAARFLKINAPHVFHVREMRADEMNTMDRWLWDFIG